MIKLGVKYMTWQDLKKLDIEDIVKYINEKLSEKSSLKKIADELGVNESTIRKYVTNKGFKRLGNEFVPNEYICNSECNQPKKDTKKVDENKEITNGVTNIFSNAEFKENMLYLNNEAETIKQMLQWFKTKDDKSNTDVIEIKEGINIDLPPSNIKRTTIRINEKVWDLFNEFVEDKKIYDKHDLMGQALIEFMERYKD